MKKTELYAAWIKHKKAETKAKEKRLEIEMQIENILPKFKTKSKTLREDGFKVEIKKSENYKFNEEWETARLNIAEELRPEKISYTPVEKGIVWLKENEPEMYKEISKYITVTPGKTGFKIEKDEK